MYQQGWIDSSYISSQYLKFRFEGAWTNLIENQPIYLFNETISSKTIEKSENSILLYSVSNYNVNYSVIIFNDNNGVSIGFVPADTGEINFILGEYPYNISNETSIKTSMAIVETNAVVNTNIELIDINGINPNYSINKGEIEYPSLSEGTEISIIQVFNSAEEDSMLIEYYDLKTQSYKKGYLPISTLYNNEVTINKNNVIWNNNVSLINVMNISNTNIIYQLQSSQTIQYLYETNGFACILFNNNNLVGLPLQTGYVNLKNGIFENNQSIAKLCPTNFACFGYSNESDGDLMNNPNDGIGYITVTVNLEISNIEELSNSNIVLKSLDMENEIIIPSTISNNDILTTISRKYLNMLNVNSQFNIFVRFEYEGYTIERPITVANMRESIIPVSYYFEFVTNPDKSLGFYLTSGYFFTAQVNNLKVNENSITIYGKVLNSIGNNFIFKEDISKWLIIKDPNTGEIVQSLATENVIIDSEYSGFSIEIISNIDKLLNNNTQYILFLGFQFENIYIDIPLFSMVPDNGITTSYIINKIMLNNIFNKPMNGLGTGLMTLNSEKFIVNLHFLNGNVPTNEILILGNIEGDFNFTKDIVKNLVVKNNVTESDDSSVVMGKIEAISTNWFSEDENNYSSFSITLNPTFLNSLIDSSANTTSEAYFYIEFEINGIKHTLPILNFLNMPINAYNSLFGYFSAADGLPVICCILYDSLLSQDSLIPKEATENSPWIGIATSVTRPCKMNSNNSGQVYQRGEIINNIIGEKLGCYIVEVSDGTYYYPTNTIDIIQK